MENVLIVGLGNPGKEYEKTRHNIGFMCIDFFIKEKNITLKENFKGYIGSVKVENFNVYFLEPLTYMNNSGEAVIEVANFYKIKPENIIVIHDDMDLDVGTVKFRTKGSAGGHNGIKSIIKYLNSEEFKRVKIGIGKPHDLTVVDYVLGKFSKDEQELISKGIEEVYKFLDYIIYKDKNFNFDKAISYIANEHNK